MFTWILGDKGLFTICWQKNEILAFLMSVDLKVDILDINQIKLALSEETNQLFLVVSQFLLWKVIAV